MTPDRYLSLRELAIYSSLSERTLRGYLRSVDHPLPHFRVGGRVLIRRSAFDSWLEIFAVQDDDAEAAADRLLKSLDARPRPGAA